MKPYASVSRRSPVSGFSLFEVVLAVGVLSISILALLGLFGPTMSSVRDVVDSNEANGVRTRLNAALMSDEIYTKLGMDQATRFEDFAGLLQDPTGGSRSPRLLYFWNERVETQDPITLEYAANTGAFDDQWLNKVEGSAFVVALERGLQGEDDTRNYDFGTVQSQGHFPILVSIYPVSPSDFINKDEGDFVTMVETVEPVFTYTTAKLR